MIFVVEEGLSGIFPKVNKLEASGNHHLLASRKAFFYNGRVPAFATTKEGLICWRNALAVLTAHRLLSHYL